MQIQIAALTRDDSSVTITFAEQITNFDSEELTTDIGTRALRILQDALGFRTPLYVLESHKVSFAAWNNDEPDILCAAFQHRLNKYANTPLDIEFGSVRVRPKDGTTPLRGLGSVRELRAGGELIRVRQTLTLSLPTAQRDITRLHKIVPLGGVRSSPRLNKIELDFLLTNELADQNPWTVIRSLQPAIRLAIT